MTLRLILTRHAKSAWDDPLMDDHDRPLNRRGRASARAIGQWLVGQAIMPDQALVSSALRTRETWNLIADQFQDQPERIVRDDLYHAEPDAMLDALRSATGRTVSVVAHNPGSAFFAQGLATQPPADSRFGRYPTAATAIFEFPADRWRDVVWRSGKVVGFVVPRDLL